MLLSYGEWEILCNNCLTSYYLKKLLFCDIIQQDYEKWFYMKIGELQSIDKNFLDCCDELEYVKNPLSHEAIRYGNLRDSQDSMDDVSFSSEVESEWSIKNPTTYIDIEAEVIKKELDECLKLGTAARCAEYARQIQIGRLGNVELHYALELYKKAFIKYFESFKQEMADFHNLPPKEKMEQAGKIDSRVEQIRGFLPKDDVLTSVEAINAAIKYISTVFVYIPTKEMKLEMDINLLHKEWDKLNAFRVSEVQARFFS